VAGVVGGVTCARHPRSLRAYALGAGIGRVVQLGFVDTGLYEPLTRDPLGWFQALAVPWMVGNALLVEQVFNIPGVFRYTPGAVSNGDFPLLQGMVMVGAVLVVIGNLLADLALAWLDPRVRGQ
jgi:binding-protein-dependent transport system inner membrane component